MNGPSTKNLLRRAWRHRIPVPGFNIPYPPMLDPIVQALCDSNSFGLIMGARSEWTMLQASSIETRQFYLLYLL